MDEPTLTISEVAEQAGVNASAIRYYERVGVLPKPDRFGGERRYTSEAVGKLQVVELAKGAGFTLDQIKDLLKSDHPRDVLSAMAKRKLPTVRALAERATAMQESATDGDLDSTSDWCAQFAQSIEEIAAAPGGAPDED
jgi:MerR family transcriptional regulator, redox-sensitive transcriptional activator SoxR